MNDTKDLTTLDLVLTTDAEFLRDLASRASPEESNRLRDIANRLGPEPPDPTEASGSGLRALLFSESALPLLVLGMLAGLTACTPGAGDPAFGSCGPGRVREDFPITIGLSPGAEDFAAHLDRAVAVWESAVGAVVFIPIGPVPLETEASGTLVLVESAATDHGETQTTLDGCWVLAQTVPVSPDPIDLAAHLTHELGHVLRLVHDTSPTSVMYPLVPGGHDVAPEDIAALKQLLGLGLWP